MEKQTVDLILPAGLDHTLALQIAELQDGTDEWREELEEMGVTEEMMVWQPGPKLHSIGALILHMVEAEVYWIEQVAAGREVAQAEWDALMSSEIDQYGFSWPTPPRKPLGWYYDAQDAARRRTLETLRSLGDPMRVGVARETPFTLRKILAHVINHEAYTGGQAVLLAILFRQQSPSR